MKCIKCKVNKLSKEFLQDTLTENCDHAPLICLRCVVAHVNQNKACVCGEPVDPASPEIKSCEALLSHMFSMYTTTDAPPPVVTAAGDHGQRFSVVLLDGDSTTLQHRPTKTIQQVKQEIEAELHHKVAKQRLIFNEKELKVYKEDGTLARLCDYGVQPHSTVHLMILLYSIPEKFDQVVFDLYWGYPSNGPDFLDASCLVYSGQNLESIVDYNRRGYTNAIWHSGDVMNNITRQGHHTINVKLQSIPSDVTHLFFTLSAWNSPNISRFPNPSLKFFEASEKTKDLCNTTFAHAGLSQAVIMCSVSRVDGVWQIFNSGRLSNGNAKNYSPIQNTIQKLIASGI